MRLHRELSLFLVGIIALGRQTPTTALTLAAGQRIAPLRRVVADRPQQRQRDGPSSSSESGTFASVPDGSNNNNSARCHRRRTTLFDLPAVEQWASRHGLREHHLKTLYRILLRSNRGSNSSSTHDGEESYSRLLSLFQEQLVEASFPKQLAAQLLRDFDLGSLRLVERRRSRSGGEKLVLQLVQSPNSNNDNNCNEAQPQQSDEFLETVLIRHETSKQTRYTVCVSSQVGCGRACTFCATGTLGLRRQLTGAEILQQVWWARRLLLLPNRANSGSSRESNEEETQQPVVRNVVFMGMGEPLDNYSAVHEACRGLTHQCLFGLKAKHVTISTVGVSPRNIRRLADDATPISLALSLHGATQELRSQLMPLAAQQAPLEQLEAALDYHAAKTGRGAMVEYLLIDGVNDSAEACTALVDFCRRRERKPTYVNLIPYNPTLAGLSMGYQTPAHTAITAFHERLQQEVGIIQSHVRWSSAAGRDAEGACGQLALSVLNKDKTGDGVLQKPQLRG